MNLGDFFFRAFRRVGPLGPARWADGDLLRKREVGSHPERQMRAGPPADPFLHSSQLRSSPPVFHAQIREAPWPGNARSPSGRLRNRRGPAASRLAAGAPVGQLGRKQAPSFGIK